MDRPTRLLPLGSVLVVVPALNEQTTIGAVVQSVIEENFDVLVVDDGSTDRTGVIAAAAGAKVARLPINLGVGGALQCAFTYAVRNGYSAVVQCDADGQHRGDEIKRLVEGSVECGADMVIGSRFRSKDTTMSVPALRRVAMAVLSAQATIATSSRITDSTSGFRLIREPLLSQFALEFPSHYLGDTHEALVSAGRAGFKVREIAATMHVRAHGDSSATVGAALRYAVRSAFVSLTGLNFSTRRSVKRPDPEARDRNMLSRVADDKRELSK